jgi:signal transduction histidine kinase
MPDPRIVKFPGPPVGDECSRMSDADRSDLDLQTILHAWNEATDRLQQTHETLRAEVRRLTAELEAKNRELARQNRLADLGQMAAHVAHEVRNSLVPMKLYLSLLRRRISEDTGSVEVLDKVSGGFTALEATVSDLLHFSSDREPEGRQFDLSVLLNEVCQSLAPQLEAQGISTDIDCPAGFSICADRDLLRRAALNLVLNALDAMPEGGQLVITVCRSSRGIEIEIADSGPGIDESLFDRICEPFFTTKPSGTGLGLAIVDRIASAHGGQLRIANCPEGGASFTLSIPSLALVSEKAA